MTCIIGLVHNGRTYLGGDSAASNSYSIITGAEPKVFTLGEFMIGMSGDPRASQLVRYNFTPPDHDPRCEDGKFICTAFVDALRKCLQAGGYAKNISGEETQDSFLLLGYRGKLYTIETNYQVIEEAADFTAIGSGAMVARGAMFAGAKLKPRDRITTALEAAALYVPSVRGPFTVIDK